MTAAASELDLMDTVRPTRTINGVWQVFNEPSTVDILIHHRDAQPLPPRDAFTLLLWRSGPSQAALLSANVAGIPAYAAAVLAAPGGGPLPSAPTGWTLQATTAGAGQHLLTTALDARLPRAVSIDVDLSGVPAGHFVLFLVVVGSTVDPWTAAPSPTLPVTATLADLVQRWPYAAGRLVQVFRRPP